MKKLVLFLIIIISNKAIACSVPPTAQHASDLDLINRTSKIVLAKVKSAIIDKDSYSVLYRFEKIKAIKGDIPRAFTITGHPLYEGGLRTFNHHYDQDFWLNSWGRASNDTDCVIYPAFSVGASFLLFLDEPYHSKSFELIIRTHGDSKTKDKWLQFVEQQVALTKL